MMDSFERRTYSAIAAIVSTVDEIKGDISEAIKSYIEEDLIPELTRLSPKDTGNYSQGWVYRKKKGYYTVFNKNRPDLTYMLEYGYERKGGTYKVTKGKRKGTERTYKTNHMPAQPHMDQAIENTENKLIQKITDYLGG